MTIQQVMPKVFQWATATEALAAVGAELTLRQQGATAPPEVAAALAGVAGAAGLGDLDELAPPERAAVVGVVRMILHQSLDLLDHPDRSAEWTYTDPYILDGFGRGSAMLPATFADAHPDLADVEAFLDVGTGVGLLACAAAQVWPGATVVGIDPWEPSLARARANVADAGLEDRITVRSQTLADLDDVDTYDAAWIPTFFLTEEALAEGLKVVVGALRPGGWVILGIESPIDDPLEAAATALRWVRGGGGSLRADRAAQLLEETGFEAVHVAEPSGPIPLDLLLGQRPT
jgi:SAM-dependent methyltransferase